MHRRRGQLFLVVRCGGDWSGSSVVRAAQVKAYMMEERDQASIALFLHQQLRITALLGGFVCSLGLQLLV
jgi:hypothetical protein